MPIYCAVADCKNSSYKGKTGSGITFHCFPKDSDTCKRWLTRGRRADRNINPKTSRICSAHFLPNDYDRDLQAELLNTPSKKRLKANAVPLVFSSRHEAGVNLERQERYKKRQWKALVQELIEAEAEPLTRDISIQGMNKNFQIPESVTMEDSNVEFNLSQPYTEESTQTEASFLTAAAGTTYNYYKMISINYAPRISATRN